jgi:hypothetical protein
MYAIVDRKKQDGNTDGKSAGAGHVGASHIGTKHVGAGHVGAGHVGTGHMGCIILVSDGIHDNLDPKHLGQMPRDLTLQHYDYGHWDDIPGHLLLKLQKVNMLVICWKDAYHTANRSLQN